MNKIIFLLLLWVPFLAGMAEAQTPGAGNILYVNINVSGGTGTGNDWPNAIPQLADALRYARSQYDADNTVYDATPLKIYVAKGTYKPLYNAADNHYGMTGSATSGFTDSDNAFVMVKNVHIYGGFDPDTGIEDLTDARNYTNTILSGDLDNNGTRDANDAYHLVISSGDVGSALLDGFTLTGAYSPSAINNIVVNDLSILRNSGGGMYNRSSSPAVTNCIFAGNTAFFSGGMYNYESSPVLINTTMANNGDNGFYIYAEDIASIFAHNSIIWETVLTEAHGGGGLSYTYSLVRGYPGDQNGNVNALPHSLESIFTDHSVGDYTLKSGSPAINAGSNDLFPGLDDARDLAGSPRLIGNDIDMGAYESADGALPVRWISFEGRLSDQHQAMLTWKTEEHNVSRYEAERSANGRDFRIVGKVAAGGTGPGSYSLPDPVPVSGTVYYRIRQVDFDGTFSYSGIISVRATNGNALKAYPNPTREAVTVEPGNEHIGSRVSLLNAAGIVLQQVEIKTEVLTIDLHPYPSGVYLLHTPDGKVIRLIRE